jgi:hypothetical protein
MDVVEWCRMHDIWYLKIDLEIPDACISEAQAVYDEGFFVDHRYGDGDGWESASLHGFVPDTARDTSMGWHHTKNPSGHGLTEETVKWGWTEIAEIAPETKRWLEDFPHKIYRRCRFMLLRPNGRIEAHHDQHGKNHIQHASSGRPYGGTIAAAINLAFYQPDNCYLRRADTKEELPFKNCTGFWFDNGVVHEAHNASNENRFHFIIHGGSNKERKELMKRSLAKQFGNNVLKEID